MRPLSDGAPVGVGTPGTKARASPTMEGTTKDARTARRATSPKAAIADSNAANRRDLPRRPLSGKEIDDGVNGGLRPLGVERQ